MGIRLKRAYEKPDPEDGCRVLVDRIWPRGVKKEELRVDFWMKEIAPSTELRRWFGHDPSKWDEFRQRYFLELEGLKESVESLRNRARQGPLTLVYGAADEKHNNAAALKELLESANP
ncbi:MAG: DUF488 domain-containing protein [Deltaproteobacteria bacterium]|nr:DUF488 domain-containing protein [Deltaproteobacteria bacterium]